jgi:putative component of toxin-antitoxin plasmid stabilization module
LTLKEQMQVDSRIARIEQFGHFGDVKNLGDGLAEL